MIDWEFQWHSTPPERFHAVSIALLAIASVAVEKLLRGKFAKTKLR